MPTGQPKPSGGTQHWETRAIEASPLIEMLGRNLGATRDVQKEASHGRGWCANFSRKTLAIPATLGCCTISRCNPGTEAVQQPGVAGLSATVKHLRASNAEFAHGTHKTTLDGGPGGSSRLSGPEPEMVWRITCRVFMPQRWVGRTHRFRSLPNRLFCEEFLRPPAQCATIRRLR